jgi:DUF177 domain-containing protein
MKWGPLKRLDPRAPLVLDSRELARRPGSSKRVSRTEPAPPDLRIELIGVPEGSPVQLDLLLESVMEGILASGTARASLAGECARCLDPVEDELVVELQELYVYPESDARDDEASRLEGDYLDLEPVLRDAVVLALPFRPVCDDDCPGLCAECGARLVDEPAHHHAEPTDPRWAALASLTADNTAGRDDATGENEE